MTRFPGPVTGTGGRAAPSPPSTGSPQSGSGWTASSASACCRRRTTGGRRGRSSTPSRARPRWCDGPSTTRCCPPRRPVGGQRRRRPGRGPVAGRPGRLRRAPGGGPGHDAAVRRVRGGGARGLRRGVLAGRGARGPGPAVAAVPGAGARRAVRRRPSTSCAASGTADREPARTASRTNRVDVGVGWRRGRSVAPRRGHRAGSDAPAPDRGQARPEASCSLPASGRTSAPSVRGRRYQGQPRGGQSGGGTSGHLRPPRPVERRPSGRLEGQPATSVRSRATGRDRSRQSSRAPS